MARRRKYTWLPNLGTDLAGTIDWAGRAGTLDVPGNGSINTIIIPLMFDIPQDAQEPLASSMADAVGSEYVIERIVGKLVGYVNPVTPDEGVVPGVTIWSAIRLTAGLFVARAGETAEGQDAPIGAGPTGVPDPNVIEVINRDYSPASLDAIREPWMWRRTWILRNAAISNTIDFPAPADPGAGLAQGRNIIQTSTQDFGSVLDGPHLDVKSVRRVGQDERLWLSVAAQGFPVGRQLETVGLQNTQAQFELDYRVLGALRRAHNRGVF